MPTIETPITFSEASASLIAEKKLTVGFSYLNWSDEDLLPLRQEIRNYYRNAQRLSCVYCFNPISSVSADGAHIEHIVSKAAHEEFIFLPKNLCVICPDCNLSKKDNEALGIDLNPLTNKRAKQYPRSSNSFKIVHPHFDTYSDHIYKANRIYVDLTPKGHWTIGACKLNRFFHRFGACDEMINDVGIVEMEEKFHDAHSSPAEAIHVIADLEQLSDQAVIT